LTAHLVPFDESAALRFADRTIRPADAIQLACAAAAGVDIFVTNDTRLSRKRVPGVPVMTSLAAVPI
jgi:predicted nucleic acid-binding protein